MLINLWKHMADKYLPLVLCLIAPHFPFACVIKAAFAFKPDHFFRAEVIDECPAPLTGTVSPAVMQCAAMMPYTGSCPDLYCNAFRFSCLTFQRTATFACGMMRTDR